MKKYIISAGVAMIAISTVYAEDGSGAAGQPMMRMQAVGQAGSVNGGSVMVRSGADAAIVRGMPMAATGMMLPVITTGDTAIDAKIKTLQEERVAKIKAINLEYDAKIKALIGDKTITVSRPNAEPGDSPSTGAAGMGRMMLGGSASTTARPPMTGLRVHTDDDVEGVAESEPAAPGLMRNFFNRLFNRGN